MFCSNLFSPSLICLLDCQAYRLHLQHPVNLPQIIPLDFIPPNLFPSMPYRSSGSTATPPSSTFSVSNSDSLTGLSSSSGSSTASQQQVVSSSSTALLSSSTSEILSSSTAASSSNTGQTGNAGRKPEGGKRLRLFFS